MRERESERENMSINRLRESYLIENKGSKREREWDMSIKRLRESYQIENKGSEREWERERKREREYVYKEAKRELPNRK